MHIDLWIVSNTRTDLAYRSLRQDIITNTNTNTTTTTNNNIHNIQNNNTTMTTISSQANQYHEIEFNDARGQYYELGRLFGKALTYIDPPTFDQCLTIGLPEHQTNCKTVYIGDLKRLKNILAERNAQAPLEHRLENAIQEMCLTLQETITQSWKNWAPTQWFNSDLAVVKELFNRSTLRMKGTTSKKGPSSAITPFSEPPLNNQMCPENNNNKNGNTLTK
jgi:hypothetical protein